MGNSILILTTCFGKFTGMKRAKKVCPVELEIQFFGSKLSPTFHLCVHEQQRPWQDSMDGMCFVAHLCGTYHSLIYLFKFSFLYLNVAAYAEVGLLFDFSVVVSKDSSCQIEIKKNLIIYKAVKYLEDLT